jgi:hypothetical protein
MFCFNKIKVYFSNVKQKGIREDYLWTTEHRNG